MARAAGSPVSCPGPAGLLLVDPPTESETMARRIHPSQSELIAELEAKYAHRNLRFSSAFLGSHPLQANGRIGGMCFYFRFRWDHAALRLGHFDHARHAHCSKKNRTKARRQLRRGQGSRHTEWWLRREHKDTDHPTKVLFVAGRTDVVGDKYAGDLEPTHAAALFEELLASVVPVNAHLMPGKPLLHRGRKP